MGFCARLHLSETACGAEANIARQLRGSNLRVVDRHRNDARLLELFRRGILWTHRILHDVTGVDAVV